MRGFFNSYEREKKDLLYMMKLILLVGALIDLEIKEEK